jgi:hypothetical protein
MGLVDRIRNLGAPATREDADRLQLRQLEALGADLARPRHVVHVLYFASEPTARDGADRAARGGYETTVVPPGDRDDPWTVRAEGTRVVDASTVAAFRSWFERIAHELHGEYDGWEASRRP